MIEENLCDECKRPCDKCKQPVKAKPCVEKARILGNGEPARGYEMIDRLCEVIRTAREKHPRFAEGKWQALGVINGEVGEFARAILKNEGEDREIAEAFDSVATLWRFILGEHKTGD